MPAAHADTVVEHAVIAAVCEAATAEVLVAATAEAMQAVLAAAATWAALAAAEATAAAAADIGNTGGFSPSKRLVCFGRRAFFMGLEIRAIKLP
jgi:hypothetical protein